MKVAELIDMLSEFDEDAEVRVAVQPSWPMQHDVQSVVEVTGEHWVDEDMVCTSCDASFVTADEIEEHLSATDGDGDAPVGTVYISAPDQYYKEPYLPGPAARELGWTALNA